MASLCKDEPQPEPASYHVTSKPKSTRKGTPKARFGCLTCKKRHIKCDELRPLCLRCTQIGYTCVYDCFIREVKFEPKRLLAATPISLEDSYPELQLTSTNVLAYQPSISLFESQQEQQYFEYYRTVTAKQISGVSFYYPNVTVKQISGWTQSRVWRFLMLQAANDQSFVRHGLIAIGALGKSVDTAEPVTSPEFTRGSVQHRQFALQQYGMAIHQLRERIADTKGDIRTILISCLLTVCFESLESPCSPQSARYFSSQVGAVVQLLEKWVRKQRPQSHPQDGLYSPATSIVENELYTIFTLLDIKSTQAYDFRPISAHLELAAIGDAAVANIPEYFTDMAEARVYFSLIVRRTVHFLKVMSHINNEKVGTLELDRLIEGYNGRLNEFHLSYRAFEPVIQKVQENRASNEYWLALILRQYVKSALISIVRAKTHDFACHNCPDLNPNYTSSAPQALAPNSIFMSHELLLQESGNVALVSTSPSQDPVPSWFIEDEDIAPPPHVIGGVKPGFLNPLQAFGPKERTTWYKQEILRWYDIRGVTQSQSGTGSATPELVIVIERRDLEGRYEYEVINHDGRTSNLQYNGPPTGPICDRVSHIAS